jgi:glycosyltransferase involved in cell wall biosynthesis
MRIAHLIWSLNVGGAETMLVDIVNSQAQTDNVLLLIGNNVYDQTVLRELDETVLLNILGRPQGSRNPWYVLKLRALLARFRPDVVHAHNESFIRLVSGSRAPTVLTIHDTNVEISDAITRYDAVFSISEAARADLLARPPYSHSTVIYNGIRFAGIKRKRHHGKRPFRTVQISRFEPAKKGQDILLRAIADVIRTMGAGSVTVDFIGGGKTPAACEARALLEGIANGLGIGSSCNFLGELPRAEIYSRLADYDLLVQPSRYEGFGLTVVEAMAAHVPVLVSDIEGPMEIIEHGKHGYHFHCGDHQDCGRKIIEIITQSQTQEFAENRRRAAEHVREHFDIALTAKQYLEEYRRIIVA